jgi:hypothetical protein
MFIFSLSRRVRPGSVGDGAEEGSPGVGGDGQSGAVGVFGVANQHPVRRGRNLHAVAVAGAVAARVPDDAVRLRRGHHDPLDPQRARLPGRQSAAWILPRPARCPPAPPGCAGRRRSPRASPRTAGGLAVQIGDRPELGELHQLELPGDSGVPPECGGQHPQRQVGAPVSASSTGRPGWWWRTTRCSTPLTSARSTSPTATPWARARERRCPGPPGCPG